MSPLHKRIEVREETITETDGLPDIIGAVAVHPGFCNCIICIGRMDGESGLEDTVLDPSYQKLRFGSRTVESADVTALVGHTA